MTKQTETVDQLKERLKEATPLEKAKIYTLYFFENTLDVTEEEQIFDTLRDLQFGYPSTDPFFSELHNKGVYVVDSENKNKNAQEKYQKYAQKVLIFGD